MNETPQLNWNNGRPWSVGDKVLFKPLGLKSVKAVVVGVYDITEDECYLMVSTLGNDVWYVPSSQCRIRFLTRLRFEHLMFDITKTIVA